MSRYESLCYLTASQTTCTMCDHGLSKHGLGNGESTVMVSIFCLFSLLLSAQESFIFLNGLVIPGPSPSLEHLKTFQGILSQKMCTL